MLEPGDTDPGRYVLVYVPRSGDVPRCPEVATCSGRGTVAAWQDGWVTTSRSGFASLVGRPNAGKSTLTNALVGGKIAITSSKPQTTRHAIRGLVNREDAQLILIDTPGLHKPHTLLGERLNALVRSTWSEVDTIGMCLPANETVGEGDKFLIRELAQIRRKPVFAIATKTDLVKPDKLRDHLLQIQQAGIDAGLQWQEIIPASAVAND